MQEIAFVSLENYYSSWYR